MADITLHILKPSVNNLTRPDLRPRRRARLRGGRRLGQDELAGVPRDGPGAAHADDRGGRPAPRSAVGELRDHAVPLQQARPRSVLPARSGERAMVDSAMFYIIGSLYPLLTRATYGSLGFPQYPGEVGSSSRCRRPKASCAAGADGGAREPLEVFRAFFLDGKSSSVAPTPVDRRHPARRLARVPPRDRLPFPAWRRSTWARSSRPSGTRTQSRWPTCAATSSTRGRRAPSSDSRKRNASRAALDPAAASPTPKELLYNFPAGQGVRPGRTAQEISRKTC